MVTAGTRLVRTAGMQSWQRCTRVINEVVTAMLASYWYGYAQLACTAGGVSRGAGS